MTSTSSVPLILDALLDTLTAAMPVPVFEAWPGDAAAEREMVFFGETTWLEYVIPTIKAGRKARQENYEIEFEVWRVLDEGTTPAAPKASRDRCFELFGLVEDALAEDVTAGAGFESIQWAVSRPETAGPRKFERGFAYRVAGSIEVHARLS